MPPESNQSNVWKQFLDQEWQERRKITDWMSIPSNHEHVARVLAMSAPEEAVHWPDYVREAYLEPAVKARGQKETNKSVGLSMLSLGSGDGSIEEKLITEFRWPISHLVCAEYDKNLVEFTRSRLAKAQHSTKVECFTFDFDKDFHFGQFDIVFFCHSLHHASDMERMLANANRSLKDDGFLIGLDYFGPVRLQLDPEVKKVIDEIFSILPPELRVNLLQNAVTVDERFRQPTLLEMKGADPSEAPRSADLRSIMLSNFPVVEIRPMGGTILRPLLANRAGNFTTDTGKAVLGLLQLLERKLIEGRLIQSDNLFVVLRKSSVF